jgi:mono/diheme cytochrome c family protein
MWKGLSMMTAAMVIAITVRGTAQERKPAVAVDTGRGLFLLYCASCHGPEGRGNGPAADEFWHRPSDLTQFAKRNGGVFNDALIYRVVDGRAVKSHGTMEMPVWGDAFKRRLGLDDDAVKERIEAIVRYVGSIQERAGH